MCVCVRVRARACFRVCLHLRSCASVHHASVCPHVCFARDGAGLYMRTTLCTCPTASQMPCMRANQRWSLHTWAACPVVGMHWQSCCCHMLASDKYTVLTRCCYDAYALAAMSESGICALITGSTSSRLARTAQKTCSRTTNSTTPKIMCALLHVCRWITLVIPYTWAKQIIGAPSYITSEMDPRGASK